MMLTILPLLFTVAFLSLLLVLVLAFLTRRRERPPIGRAVRGWTIAAALVVIVAVVASRLVRVQPWGAEWITDPRLHHALPLGAGLLAVALLAVPLARWRPSGTATLSPRGPASFAERWWLVAPVVVGVVILVVSVLAGRVSIPDSQGRYVYYEVEFGPSRIGTGIYGWHLSVPSMVVLGLLLVATFTALQSVARPPLRDYPADAAARRWRSSNVVAISTGAMLLHLYTVLASLVGTASMYGRAVTGGEWFTAQPPFVILRTPMLVGAWIAEFAGWFLCFAVLVAALMPARESSRRSSSWQSASR